MRNPNWQYGAPAQIQQVRDAVGNDDDVAFIDAQGLATRLLGDAIYTNPFMLGYAWQRGWVPLAYETLMRAIELNGVAIDANKRAFDWGRASAHDLEAVKRIAYPDAQVVELKRADRTNQRSRKSSPSASNS